MKRVCTTVEEYIASFPEDVQKLLMRLRQVIVEKAPEAVESITYNMPSYKTNGRRLVYFAAYKNHIGFYALPSAHSEFGPELSKYKQGKGSVQFPLDKSIPWNLIGRMVEFRVWENEAIFNK